MKSTPTLKDAVRTIAYGFIMEGILLFLLWNMEKESSG